MLKTLIIIFVYLLFCVSVFAQAKLEYVVVNTTQKENKEVKVWYRVPSGYDESSKTNYRVLVFFGGRNFTAQRQIEGNLGFDKFADKNNMFIVTMGLTNDDYWEPRKWSGKVLLQAIEQISKKYKICTNKLLFYGYSAGGQCSNTFPAYMPEKTRAWVSHACGYFHKPITKMKNIPALITCGDADGQRYLISRNFIYEYRKLGANILWKSFPNRPHDIPKGSIYLAQAFLEYYHNLYIDDLKSNIGGISASKESKKFLYIGDDLEGVIYPASSSEAKNILAEDRVYFTSEEIAKAWQKSSEM